MDEQVSFSLNQRSDQPFGLAGGDPDARDSQLGQATPRVAVPRWTMATAGAAPLLLVSGFVVAAAIQPSYDPISETMSALAAPRATDPWVMEAILLALGACYVATAVGLRTARRAGRIALAAAGFATALIAASPTPPHGYSRGHAIGVILASATMCTWPLLAAHRQHRARMMTRAPNAIASGVTLILVFWFVLALGGGDVGLAERCAAVAPALWLFPVAFGTRRSLVLDDRHSEPTASPDGLDEEVWAHDSSRYGPRLFGET